MKGKTLTLVGALNGRDKPGVDTVAPKLYDNGAPAESCFRCVHHRYKGPFGVLPDAEAAQDTGTYRCGRFDQTLSSADEIPRPLTRSCKEESSDRRFND